VDQTLYPNPMPRRTRAAPRCARWSSARGGWRCRTSGASSSSAPATSASSTWWSCSRAARGARPARRTLPATPTNPIHKRRNTAPHCPSMARRPLGMQQDRQRCSYFPDAAGMPQGGAACAHCRQHSLCPSCPDAGARAPARQRASARGQAPLHGLRRAGRAPRHARPEAAGACLRCAPQRAARVPSSGARGAQLCGDGAGGEKRR